MAAMVTISSEHLYLKRAQKYASYYEKNI